ncbi:MAG: aminotransferase class I/II-fold pyridoxal phosphate-dependent enzyme [Candidatus Heimdallarchaeaceae archaeon]
MSKFTKKCKKYSRFGAPTIAKKMGYYPYFMSINSEQNPIVEMDGKPTIMLGSNNYLGMTSHPEVKKAAIEAIEEYGVGTTGSRLLNGTMELHVELEKRLAKFFGKEDCVIFSTGMLANMGGISALLTEDDEWVLSDQYNHASIIDGIRLGRINPEHKYIFKHNDMSDLEQGLKQVPKGKGMIITDGVFSMEGDIAPLDEISDLAEDYDACVYVDDAHGAGVIGPHGKGTAAKFGITDKVDIIMGTFSKSFASVGGYIATSEEICNWIRHKARPFIFTASPPPSTCATVLSVLDIIEKDNSYQQNVLNMSSRMKEGLLEAGFEVTDSHTAIIPLIIGSEKKMINFFHKLYANEPTGIFTNPVTSPATPKGRELLRTSYMATMHEDIIDEALEIIVRIGKSLKII